MRYMRYYALACDFDGTLAWNGQVDAATIVALHRVRDSGRKLILVTGRELDDLIDHLPQLDLFDRIVAENGAVIYRPVTNDQRVLGDPPPKAFIDDLHQRGISPISVGDVVVATWHPHEAAVLDTIEMHGLEHHVVFNKGAVMVLPAGVNKATGLVAALHELRLSPRNTVCIGDAENDQAMFRACELAVAVNNALATVKANADLVTRDHHGAGMIEVIDQLVANDLSSCSIDLHRHDILLGRGEVDVPIVIDPYESRVLLAGAPGSGKSMLATGVIERLTGRGYQVCVIDPEGDYGTIPDIIHVGDSQQPPSVEEILQLLEYPSHSVVANLLGMPFGDRPAFLAELCGAIRRLRDRTGRPHWLIVDEAHHLLPTNMTGGCSAVLAGIPGLLLITVDPRHLAPDALRTMTLVVAVDSQPSTTLQSYAELTNRTVPDDVPAACSPGEGIVWNVARDGTLARFRAAPCRSRHRRHRRKYAEGDIGWERSFYFRGPAGRHDLRAPNLIAFMDTADDVADETWLYHADQGDFSHWIRDTIGDGDLADAVAEIEAAQQVPRQERGQQMRRAIEQRYTLPA